MRETYVSKMLLSLRKSHKYTQAKVAQSINLSRQAYAKYEKAEGEPGLSTISKLCNLYSINPQEFFISELREPKINMFLSELGMIYEFKYRRFLELNFLIRMFEEEKNPNFPYERKNQVTQEEYNKYLLTQQELVIKINEIRNTIIKVMENDDPAKYIERRKEPYMFGYQEKIIK